MEILNQGYELVPLDQLKRHPQNPNRGDLPAIRESIDANGFFGAVYAQRSTGYILAGNHRYEVAEEKKAPEIPTIWLDVDDDQATRILLADNAIARLGVFDEKKLSDLLKTMHVESGSLAGTGYSKEKMDELLAAVGEQQKKFEQLARRYAPKDESDAHELQEKWETAACQIWEIPSKSITGASHFLGIGDSLKDFPTLLGGVVPDGVCTDPPYELDTELVANILRATKAPVASVMCGDRQAIELAKHWTFKLMLIWKHRMPRMTPNPNLPLVNHTLLPIYVASPDGKTNFKKPVANMSSLFETEKEYEASEFGHAKSPEVFQKMIEGFETWRVVADPFAGTGGVLLACEILRRQCYSMEMDPSHAAVALDRFKQAGLEPRLLGERREASLPNALVEIPGVEQLGYKAAKKAFFSGDASQN